MTGVQTCALPIYAPHPQDPGDAEAREEEGLREEEGDPEEEEEELKGPGKPRKPPPGEVEGEEGKPQGPRHPKPRGEELHQKEEEPQGEEEARHGGAREKAGHLDAGARGEPLQRLVRAPGSADEAGASGAG